MAIRQGCGPGTAASGRGLCAVALAIVAGMVAETRPADAACAPAAGDSVTVTCTGTTIDQGKGFHTGYGAGNQSGVTIDVQPGVSVIGTSTGIDLGTGNTVNNAGTITTNGINNVYGINAVDALTVVNSGTIGRVDLVIPANNNLAGINTGSNLVVTNTATVIIQGQVAIQAPSARPPSASKR